MTKNPLYRQSIEKLVGGALKLEEPTFGDVLDGKASLHVNDDGDHEVTVPFRDGQATFVYPSPKRNE